MPDLFRHPTRGNYPRIREIQPCIHMPASKRFGTLYAGVTSNPIGRVIQHREGAFPGFTQRYGVKMLVWFETADTMDAAIAREKTMKKWSRDWKCNMILSIGLGLEPLG